MEVTVCEKSASRIAQRGTHFEIKYLERGELCQQLIITKPEGYRTRFDAFQALQGQNPQVQSSDQAE